MTTGWDDELAHLRELYLGEAVPRLESLDRALEVLARTPGDRGALASLRRGFHSFAGSGATYGLDVLSILGAEGERRVEDVGTAAPVASDLAFWRRVTADLRREVARAAEG